jgi:SAM-dependent methyltransferase
MKKQIVKYIYDESVHNMNAPSIVVPYILELFPTIHSVVDFGCGTGTWLKAFKNKGIDEVLGLDGTWNDPNLLFQHINENEFQCVDLEKPIGLNKIYDLVVSLEVAEHLRESSADTFVQSLVDAGKIILFSAATPGQRGFKHINEQWPSYWVDKFRQHGYKTYDIVREKIWNYPEVETWYKQNMFLAIHHSIQMDCHEADIQPLVHPDTKKLTYKLRKIKRGISLYSRLLLKSIFKL